MEFDTTGEKWRLATFDEMYATVDNGGLLPWDDNDPTDNVFLGMKANAFKTAASLGALASAAILYI